MDTGENITSLAEAIRRRLPGALVSLVHHLSIEEMRLKKKNICKAGPQYIAIKWMHKLPITLGPS